MLHCSITQIGKTCISLNQSKRNHQQSLPDSGLDQLNQQIWRTRISSGTINAMSHLLDIRTLILVITIVLLCRALILGYVWTITRQYPLVKLWMIGSAMVATGALLLALRGGIPDMLSVLLANIALISGWMIISFGTLMAAEHPVPRRAGIVILVAATAGCFWFLSITPDLARRTVVTSVPPIIFDAYVGMVCLAYKGTYRKTTL